MLNAMRKPRYPQQELAHRFNDAVEESGMTPAEVARQCGVTPQAVYDWSITGRIGKQHLVTLAKILKKPLEYFLVGLGRAAVCALLAIGLSGLPAPAEAGKFFSARGAVCIMLNLLRRFLKLFKFGLTPA